MTDADDPAEDPDGDPQRDARAIALRTGRMEAFSDGVFAIAITLLVLEIQIPPDRGDDLLRAVIEEWPSYIAYAAAIGIGLAVPTVAVALYLAIALYLVIPFRSAVQAVRRSGSP